MADEEHIKGIQIRAARALLGLSADELAKMTRLSRGTIQRVELESADVTVVNMARIIETLIAEGIIFIAANGEGVGVRLTKKRARKRPQIL